MMSMKLTLVLACVAFVAVSANPAYFLNARLDLDAKSGKPNVTTPGPTTQPPTTQPLTTQPATTQPPTEAPTSENTGPTSEAPEPTTENTGPTSEEPEPTTENTGPTSEKPDTTVDPGSGSSRMMITNLINVLPIIAYMICKLY